MAGHKRPHGQPICPGQEVGQAAPDPILQRGSTLIGRHRVTPEPGLRLPLLGHWRNPNWVEPAPIIEDDNISHSSWVATEIDGDTEIDCDTEIDEEELAVEESQVDSEDRVLADLHADDDAHSTSANSNSSFSSLTQLMNKSVPLASVWSTPTRDIPAIGQAAAKAGVGFGVVPSPKYRRGLALKRDGSRNHGEVLERQDSWWVVMGQDKQAVARMIAKAEPGAEGQEVEEHQEQDPCTSSLVGAYPIHYSYLRPTFLDVLIAGAVGGFIVFYALAVF